MAYGYSLRNSAQAKKEPGKSLVEHGKKPKLGTGKRFGALEKGLEKKGAKNPGALAAYIGAKKYGRAKMVSMALHRKFAGKK